MTTSRILKSATWIFAGALAMAACSIEQTQKSADDLIKKVERTVDDAVDKTDQAAEQKNPDDESSDAINVAMAAPGDFYPSSPEKKFHSLILPVATCDTKAAAVQLSNEVKVLPTFNGTSPWPGLYGFWIHQQAGMYARISSHPKTATDLVDGTVTKYVTIKIALVDLCTKKVIATGEKTLKASDNVVNRIRIRLDKHSLKQVVNPEVIVNRIADPKSQQPIKELLGLTLRYKKTDTDKNATYEEPILLTNVLNLTF